MRPRVDEDEQAREHEASDALEDDEEVAPRLVLREEECEVRDRLVSATDLDLTLLSFLVSQWRPGRETASGWRGGVTGRRSAAGGIAGLIRNASV